jgi:hypothetical protein
VERPLQGIGGEAFARHRRKAFAGHRRRGLCRASAQRPLQGIGGEAFARHRRKGLCRASAERCIGGKAFAGPLPLYGAKGGVLQDFLVRGVKLSNKMPTLWGDRAWGASPPLCWGVGLVGGPWVCPLGWGLFGLRLVFPRWGSC